MANMSLLRKRNNRFEIVEDEEDVRTLEGCVGSLEKFQRDNLSKKEREFIEDMIQLKEDGNIDLIPSEKYKQLYIMAVKNFVEMAKTLDDDIHSCILTDNLDLLYKYRHQIIEENDLDDLKNDRSLDPKDIFGTFLAASAELSGAGVSALKARHVALERFSKYVQEGGNVEFIKLGLAKALQTEKQEYGFVGKETEKEVERHIRFAESIRSPYDQLFKKATKISELQEKQTTNPKVDYFDEIEGLKESLSFDLDNYDPQLLKLIAEQRKDWENEKNGAFGKKMGLQGNKHAIMGADLIVGMTRQKIKQSESSREM